MGWGTYIPRGEKVLSDIFDDSHYYFVVIMNK